LTKYFDFTFKKIIVSAYSPNTPIPSWRILLLRGTIYNLLYLGYGSSQTKKNSDPRSPSQMCLNETKNHFKLLSL